MADRSEILNSFGEEIESIRTEFDARVEALESDVRRLERALGIYQIVCAMLAVEHAGGTQRFPEVLARVREVPLAPDLQPRALYESLLGEESKA